MKRSKSSSNVKAGLSQVVAHRALPPALRAAGLARPAAYWFALLRQLADVGLVGRAEGALAFDSEVELQQVADGGGVSRAAALEAKAKAELHLMHGLGGAAPTLARPMEVTAAGGALLALLKAEGGEEEEHNTTTAPLAAASPRMRSSRCSRWSGALALAESALAAAAMRIPPTRSPPGARSQR